MSTTTADPVAAGSPERRPATAGKGPLAAVLKPLASLQLTVVLFALSMVLVFFGTVAMMAQGLWTVVDDYFRSFVVWIPVDLVRRFGTVFFNDVASFPKDASPWPGSFPFPAGWTIGFALLVNLLAAHLVRFKLTWKRAGVIVLHAGVVLLMVGELVTGLFAVESTMTLKVNEASDFVDVTREMEIAVTRPADAATDAVTVVPQRYFERPGTVSHPELPFDLEVLDYWRNTDLALFEERPAGDDVFPVGQGAWVRLTEKSEGAGVDTEARSDVPAARVRVTEKGTGKDLGTFLLSLWAYENFEQNRRRFEFPEAAVVVDGVKHTLQLRNKRVYKPYEVKLLQFEHGRYPGTDIPKDFASTVVVTDRETGESRDVRIWMNNPLRYAGDSLYQFAVVGADSGTVLQVVRNPGRLMPYLSCILITLGMLIHFGMRLITALEQGKVGPRSAKPTAAAAIVAPVPQSGWMRALPWAVFAVFVLWIGSKAVPPRPGENGVDYYALGQLPVREGGRVMPLDTLARTALQSVSNSTVVKNQEGDTTATAVQWLTDVLDSPDWADGPAAKHKVFRIEHDQLLGKLELPRRPGFYRYSLAEIKPKFAALESAFAAIEAKRKEGKALDLYDAKVEELGRKLTQYQRLARARDLQLVPPQEPGADWGTFREVERKAVSGIPDDEVEKLRNRAIARLSDELEREYGSIEKLPESVRGQVMSRARMYIEEELGKAARDRRGEVSPAAGALTEVVRLAREGKGGAFATALADYRHEYLTHVPESELRTARIEAHTLGQMAPFYYSAFLYLFVIVFGLASWLVWPVPLNRAAFLLMVFTLVLHSAALITRMAVMGRPPVTNLYSSAVFIGWGAVLLCAVLEWLYRNGVGLVVGGAVGAATMYLAQFLGASGDTMAMLQAVLDTNFWLATHVTTVTLGYTATLVAGAIAIMWLARMLVTVVGRGLTPGASDSLADTFWFVWSAVGLAGIATGFAYLLTRTVGVDSLGAELAWPLFFTAGVAFLGLAAAAVAVRFTRAADAPGGHDRLVRELAGRGLTPEADKTLAQMMYGVICFATLLSFVGTVLGGIWADYSWGRFWGWDPKENGAVLIVIWNALILHARWAGLVKARGMAVLAVAGNMVTAWSWFGTNQLSIGLHAYGFDDRLASGCFWFWVSQAVVMAFGMVPQRYWRVGGPPAADLPHAPRR